MMAIPAVLAAQRANGEANRRRQNQGGPFGGGDPHGPYDRDARKREQTAAFDEMVAKVQAAQNTKAAPGELTQMHDGEAPIKSAVDLGDPLAVRTLAELDPTTLTAPCCDVGTVLVYLRQTPDHPHYSTMVTCIEGLILENGLVPFKDGSAVPVDILTQALEDRDEVALTEVLRDGTIDFRQFKTLRAVLSLPQGFERTDASFMFLVNNARERKNPNGSASGDLAFDGGAGGGGCAVM